MSPAIVFKGEWWPLRPKPDIWLTLLVPVRPILLKPRLSPSPKLDAGEGMDMNCD